MFMKTYTLLFLAATVSASAQTNWTAEALLQINRISNPCIHADGKAIFYDVATVEVAQNKSYKKIWSYSLTSNASAPLGNPTWNEWMPKVIANSKTIGFLSTRDGSPQVHTMNLDGSNLKAVTEVEGGVSDFCFSKDGKRLAILADVKTGMDVHDRYPDLPKTEGRIIDDLFYRNWDSWDDFASTHIWLFDVVDGKAVNGRDVMKDKVYDALSMVFSPDGNFLVYEAKPFQGKDQALSTNTDLFAFEISNGKEVNLTAGRMGYDREAAFSPDGKMLAWTSLPTPGYESDRSALMVMDWPAANHREIDPTWEESVGSLCWSGDGKFIFGISSLEGSEQVVKVSPSKKTVQVVTKGDADFGTPMLMNDRLFATRMTMLEPINLVEISAINTKGIPLTNHNQPITSKLSSASVEKNWVTTSDGKKELVWVILPPGFDPNKKYPALLYCQGGPQSMVSQFFSYRWNFQVMAASGCIVVAPNRRGLPGFGKAWNDQIAGDWGGQAMADYLSAIDSISKRPYVDKTRVGCVGASYGGYSAYWLAGHHQGRFKTFIAHCGLFNLESWYTMTDEQFFNHHDIGPGYWENGGKAFAAFSPHRFVQNWDRPILVIHGDRDYRVPMAEGMQAFGAARLRNLKSRFLYLPDEGHWVMKPQNALLWHRVFYDWLKETL
jgi:dipeptidyl aminopeptidase/acylaminoacyl peptidase